MDTPARSSHVRGSYNNGSYSPTITSGGQQSKLNVVTRVAIEGKAKQGQDGAAIKMYLKISLPLDSVMPEENVKILTSQVHPLDTNSVPFSFSSTVSPLLHNAARALNLPARSSESFYSAFALSPPPHTTSSISSSTRSSKYNPSENRESIPPVDLKYTGHILVSGYNISFVLPKSFPTRPRGSSTPTDVENDTSTRSSYRRRSSIGERNTAQFMAAIDIWVPFVTRPPRSPYLLSIPTPRCLHNNIKLRIFPPTNASASFASLSSLDEEGGIWDLTSDPHVTRSATRPSRTNSYNQFADDESSDSSVVGFSDGCGIQGTFPSAERIRVRWAKPLRTIDVPGGADGRRRVGVKEVKGEMVCIIRGKSRGPERNDVEGILMDVEFKGTCKGVWFPGVATLLGMDVGLEAKNSDVSWVPGTPNEWELGGGSGYTGFNVGTSTKAGSLDSVSYPVQECILTASVPEERPSIRPLNQPSRSDSSSSTSSLLRAPLPAQNVAEYSFEGSSATLPSTSSNMGTVSSMSSLLALTPNPIQSPDVRPPGMPITLHINMNDILPPAKNVFTFTISGTILVTPRATLHRPNNGSRSRSSSLADADDNSGDSLEPITLPRFTVLAADSETTSIIVRNETDGSMAVEVFNSTGDIYKDPQARKTVLQRDGFTRCSEDGGRIILKVLTSSDNLSYAHNHKSFTRGPSNSKGAYGPRPKRDGPIMIPSVLVIIMPLKSLNSHLPNAYAVRLCMNTPSSADVEWLEFGFAKPWLDPSFAHTHCNRKVEIACISADGIPLKFEVTTTSKSTSKDLPRHGAPFEQVSSKEWISWVKVQNGPLGGEQMFVDYVVKNMEDPSTVSRSYSKDGFLVQLVLPTFTIPVGKFEVNIEPSQGLDTTALHSSFPHQQISSAGQRLLQYSLREHSDPNLTLRIRRSNVIAHTTLSGFTFLVLIWMMLAIGLFGHYHLNSEIHQLRRSLESYSSILDSNLNETPETVTVTSTVYSDTGTRWWFAEISTESSKVFTAPFTASNTITSIPALSTPHDLSKSVPHSAGATTNISIYPSSSWWNVDPYSLLPIEQALSVSSWLDQELFRLRQSFEKLFRTLDYTWDMFRKLYHYPLDPP